MLCFLSYTSNQPPDTRRSTWSWNGPDICVVLLWFPAPILALGYFCPDCPWLLSLLLFVHQIQLMRFSIWFPLLLLSNTRQKPKNNNPAPRLVTEIFESCYLLLNSGHSQLIPICQRHLYLIISSYPLLFFPSSLCNIPWKYSRRITAKGLLFSVTLFFRNKKKIKVQLVGQNTTLTSSIQWQL